MVNLSLKHEKVKHEKGINMYCMWEQNLIIENAKWDYKTKKWTKQIVPVKVWLWNGERWDYIVSVTES